MQSLLNSEFNNEIDLRELFKTLWAYKLFIALSCALGVVYSGYYALNADKEFSSAAIFKMESSKSLSNSAIGQVDILASFAGIGNAFNDSILPVDQISGRIFIQKLDSKLNFQADPYFNTFNPNSIDPIWKSLIKSAIGWQKPSTNADEAIWQSIVSKYLKNVALSETENGSIKISVTHVNPQRAAEIANVIMEEIITRKKNKEDAEQDKQVSYLSSTLAKALSELEDSQSNLKEFALKNSALPLENFAAESLKLDALREKLSRATEMHEAVAALLLILQNKTTDHNGYLALRQKFPIVDQVEFRRVMGQNEIISSWSWPEASSVSAVFDTLSERKSRLQTQINASQINAERSSLALETYAKLQRETKIAEATYTVLIEQVKAQSMIAGYRPDNTEVYEYATASMIPSAPKRNLILALGAVLGLSTGAALSLLFALRRDVCYSNESLQSVAQAQHMDSMKSILPFRKKSIENINKMLVKKACAVLRDIAVEIHVNDSSLIVVTSIRAKLTGSDMARALASYMQSDNMKVAVIDFSAKTKKLDIDAKRLSVEPFIIAESVGNVSILRPDDKFSAMELLSQKNYIKNIESLRSTIDLLFLCADNNDAISLSRALQGQKTYHVTLARTKHTKSADLRRVRSLLPIQGLLHG